ACLYFATRDGPRHPLLYGGLAALTGGYAAYSYITPIAAAPALLITAVLAARRGRRIQAALGGLGIVAGFALTLLTFQLTVGIWNAYFLSAAKYGVGAHSPIDTIGDRLEPLWETQPAGREFLSVTAAQTMLTLVLVGLVLLLTLGRAVFRRRAVPPPVPVVVPDPDRGGATRVARHRGPYERFQTSFARRLPARDLAFLLAAGGVWLVPYIAGGQASTYRSEAYVVLVVPLLRRLPSWLLLPVLAAAVWVAWRMAPNFFNAKLI
ncbi:MAG TPA: hypothetical protein VLM05_22520, partial [Mycobacteriales bacterium]|nr:hypothetical protein [Mycobacteriales bacterium]